VALNVLAEVLSQLGIQSAANNAITQGQQQPEYLLYLIPVALLFNAPAEEFLFRGVVQGLFRKAYGPLPAVVMASALFGVVHYFALGGQGSKWAYVAIAAVLGLLLGLLYEKTENLAVPIAVHGIYNALQFYLAYLAATGQIQLPA
jgi:membrane protease YdiL (CAAX protease family)